MKTDVEQTIERIEKDLQENAEADWIPGAAPTQHYPNRLSLMLAPAEQTSDFSNLVGRPIVWGDWERTELPCPPVTQSPPIRPDSDVVEMRVAPGERVTVCAGDENPELPLYFEAKCQDCDWKIERQPMTLPIDDVLMRQALFHAHDNRHDVEYTHSVGDVSSSFVVRCKPKGFWEQFIAALSTNKGKIITAICMSVLFNMTIDYFWEIERGRGSMIIGFFSVGLCYWGICCITALWRKRKERNIG